ncbi:M3 family metallopeptidase [Devosia sp. BK]|jgi:peptidyl-dipeptidase Dcp|uniref:M3 family metallopeptidase n=1 Tax=unclassified Devosia TaxID=196773 RepID=UPI0007160416|nr:MULTISPECIES: M3 family metallopeptidase [unclassified Devosia]KQN74870.1 peptidase M3 [Devosia sp. Leaf64]MDV3253330.1 M3 family metallopeptidase [Devosia sp. BK]
MTNPFLEAWTTPFEAPPFSAIKTEHFAPAYDAAIAEHAAEIAAIADNAEAPSFENTVVALELSGKNLDRLDLVFSQLTSAKADDALQAVERDVAPLLARHWNAIFLNPKLFARVDALYTQRDALGLSPEALRVLERYHLDFVRAGAQLSADERQRFADIVERLAVLGTTFGQKVLADEQDTVFALSEAEAEGLPESALAAAAETARDRKLNAPYAVTTSRSSVEPVLHFARDRSVREKVWRAFVKRGANGNANDTHAVIAEILGLRTELAKLLGYSTYAEFKLADSMAKTPKAARDLLERVWAPGRERALADKDALQHLIDSEGGDFKLAAWDWRYYAEKLRLARYDFDETAIKPYLELDKVIEAAFYTAERLFGVSFVLRPDIEGYHDDVRVWEVQRAGRSIGLFYGDFFARPGKRSGAWMTSFRKQSKLDGDVLPLIVNTCNFMKPPAGQPALLSLDEARTVFHEFGHGLHGLLSDVTFPRISGTSVARDFVELPSQIYEHWLESKPVLERLVHYRTGETIPPDLLEKLKAAGKANSGFETVEFVSSALLDMDLHSKPLGDNPDIVALEAETLADIGMPAEIALRHASTHFLHLFSGDGYAAGYYSYLWSEVLDADGFDAFEEVSDPFDTATAERLYRYVYSAGGSRDYAEAYRLFRGRDPDVGGLLKHRGFETEGGATG